MAAGPCLNPSCNSHGSPHPNCRCYGGMAEGGEASEFCSENRAHQQGCQYFVDGGTVSFDALKADVSPTTVAAAPMKFDDLKADAPKTDFDSLVDDSEKYSTPGQQAITALEGGAQGYAGPLAPLAETKLLGIPKEDIIGRAEANPLTHGVAEATGLGAGFLTGTGEAGLVAKAGLKLLPKVAEASRLSTLGSSALRGATEAGLLQGSDEISKALLGQGEAYPAVAAHIAEAGALGLFAGGLFGAAEGALASKASVRALETLENQRLGTRAESFTAGLGAAAESAKEADEVARAAILRNSRNQVIESGGHSGMFDTGADFFNTGMNKVGERVAQSVTAPLGAVIGSHIGGVPGAIGGYKLAKDCLQDYVAKLVSKPLTSGAQKYAFPALLKALNSGQTQKLWSVLNNASQISKGAIKINNSIEGLFKAGIPPVTNEINAKDRDKLEKFIEDGGVEPQIEKQMQGLQGPSNFAEGGIAGSLEEDKNSEMYPGQHMMTSMIQGRVSTYLRSLQPSPQQGLPFDTKRENPQARRQFGKAVDIALQPLSVLDKVKRGTVTQDDMKHLNGMYPELHQYLGQKIEERGIHAQLNDEKPSYKVRQSLSMFLGTALESSLTPSSIQAAQAVFMKQKVGQPAPVKPKKASGTSGEKLAQSFLTQEQAAQKRQTATRP